MTGRRDGQSIKKKEREMINIKKAFREREPRKKEAIYASDFGKPAFDIWHSLLGTPVTNKIRTESLLIMECGKQIEEALVAKMRDAGEFATLAQCQDAGLSIMREQVRVDTDCMGFPVHGYVDAFDMDINPVEIKTYYGDYYGRELENDTPKPNYVMQLAVYMIALGFDSGTMLHINRGTGGYSVLNADINSELSVKCGKTTVCMAKECKRLAGVWNAYKNGTIVEPDEEYKCKITPEFLKTQSEANIKKAIKGNKVLGTHPYAIQYSAYKDYWLEAEASRKGCEIVELMGYSDAELGFMEEFIGAKVNTATGRFCKIRQTKERNLL